MVSRKSSRFWNSSIKDYYCIITIIPQKITGIYTFILQLFQLLHFIPKLIPPLMDDEISSISKSVQMLQIPPPTHKIPDELLQSNHDKWNMTNSIIISLLHGQNLHPDGVMKEMRRIWHPTNKLVISPKGNNRFACNFEGVKDKTRVEDDQPWIILNHLAIIKPFSSDINAMDVIFDRVPLMIGFKGLDVEHLDPKCVEWIAKAAGIVDVVYPSDSIPRTSEGFRARVQVDVAKPLVRTTPANTLKRGDFLVEFIYINLPTCHCYYCDKLGFFRTLCPCRRNKNTALDEEGTGDNVLLAENLSMGKGMEGTKKYVVPHVTQPTILLGSGSGKKGRMEEQILTPMKTYMVDSGPLVSNITPHRAIGNQVNQLDFAPHHFAPRSNIAQKGERDIRDEVIEIERVNIQPKKGKETSTGRPRGRPRGSKTINRTVRGKSTISPETDINQGHQKRRRGNNENFNFGTPYYPIFNPNPAETNFSHILEIMLSPFVAAKLASYGIPPPEPYGSQNKQMNGMGIMNGGGDLSELGAQIQDNLQARAEMDTQSTLFELLDTPENIIPSGDNGDYITVDHLGGLETRESNGNTIELLQAENNLMHSLATIQYQPNQGQDMTLATTQFRQNTEGYFGGSNGPSNAN